MIDRHRRAVRRCRRSDSRRSRLRSRSLREAITAARKASGGVGGLDAIQAAAPHAKVHAHGADQSDFAFIPVADGANLRGLRILETPGHTAGHLSLLVNDRTLLAGDLVGTAFGKLTRAPEGFSEDTARETDSIRRLLDIGGSRMLFGHEPEIEQPFEAVAALIAE